MSIQHAIGEPGLHPEPGHGGGRPWFHGGITAESNADGVLINMVPKEGGNIFSGSAHGLYTNESLQTDNLNDELRARGLRR